MKILSVLAALALLLCCGLIAVYSESAPEAVPVSESAEASSVEVFTGDAVPGEWTVVFVDPEGAPLQGCIINFCTDVMCTPAISDENGEARFAGEPQVYHLQVIRVPAGFFFPRDWEFYTDAGGGIIRITVSPEAEGV